MNHDLKGRPTPAIVDVILYRALHYLYTDLHNAEELYRQTHISDPELLDVIFVQPPGIVPGEVATGHELSTTKHGDMVSFADVGEGMIEMVERREELRWRGVCIYATGEVGMDWSDNMKAMVTGLVAYFAPWIWRIGRNWNFW